MTPKEKAEELFEKYWLVDSDEDSAPYTDKSMAKKCALIAVDEIINCDSYFKTIDDLRRFDYFWRAVYVEIEKL
jgi:hypothetical protein